MKWKKPSEKLVLFLEKKMKNVNCHMKIMFGYPAYFINNNMFIAIYQEDLILRLSLEEKKKVMEKYNEIAFFEPIPGRIMKEYVRIPESIYSNNKKFLELLKKSIGYVSKLPPKEKK